MKAIEPMSVIIHEDIKIRTWRMLRHVYTKWYANKKGMVFITFQKSLKYTSIAKCKTVVTHDDVIKWKNFPCYWPFVRAIHRSLVISPHKGQWCRALMFSLICALTKSWANYGDAGDLRSHRAHYDVIVMPTANTPELPQSCAKLSTSLGVML